MVNLRVSLVPGYLSKFVHPTRKSHLSLLLSLLRLGQLLGALLHRGRRDLLDALILLLE